MQTKLSQSIAHWLMLRYFPYPMSQDTLEPHLHRGCLDPARPRLRACFKSRVRGGSPLFAVGLINTFGL